MGKRILVVEDNTDTADFISAFLQLKGFDVTHVRDDSAFLEKFHGNSYDIVLLDIMLPDKDGFWIAKHIRAHGSSVPILMMTGHKTIMMGSDGAPVAHSDYIAKPFEPEQLLSRINAVMERSSARSGAKARQ